MEKNTGSSNIEDSDDTSFIKKHLKWGYIDRQNSTFISYDFNSVSSFNNGYALIIKEGRCSLVKNSHIKFIPGSTITDPFKIWKIKFSKSLKDKITKDPDDEVLNNMDMTMTDNIKVTDSSGKYKNVSFTFESPDTIVINPPYNGYEADETYTITVLSNGKYTFRDTDGNTLKPSVIKIHFSITN